MNPTPTISEAARRAAEKLCPHIHTIATQVSGNAGAEAEGDLNRVAAIIQSALDSAHPAPKEGATPETDALIDSLYNSKLNMAEILARVEDHACQLELRLSEAKHHLKTANELLGEAHAMFLPPESDFGHTPPKAALLSRIRTHLNKQSK